MYFGDHNPPHFHAEYGEYTAQIAIKDLATLQGYLPPKAIGLIAEWASIHQKELFKNWEILSEKGNGEFIKIEPLK